MGGQSTQQQQQTQSSTPWAPASGQIQNILTGLGGISPGLSPVQQGAISQLTGLGGQGNPFLGGINSATNSLLAGGGANNQAGAIGSNLSNYQQQLNPYLQSSFLNPMNTPGFGNALQTMNADITNQVNGQFAAAGRDTSPANSQALARGLSQGEGQLIANQYNQNVGNQLGAMGSAYGAGNQTGGLLSGLQQQAVGNQQAGLGAADQANQAAQYGPMLQLQAASQQTGIPLANLAAMMGIALPVGQAFGTTTGTGSGQNQMSGAQQFGLIAQGLKNIIPIPKPPGS